MNHVMLDLESLGQEAGSVITSISAVQFDTETGETAKEFHSGIKLKSSLKSEFQINPETLNWWIEQNEDARKDFIRLQKQSHNIVTVLRDFGFWLYHLPRKEKDHFYRKEDIFIWGRGPRFDMGLLSYAYQKFDMEIP